MAVTIDVVRTSRSEAETALIGGAVGKLLRGGDVLLIDGELGAGKTTLVRSIAAAMGLDTAPVASPTFVLVHEYTRMGGGSTERPELVHIDAYRLRSKEDLETTGWDTVVSRLRGKPSAALVVEWAERLGPAMERGLDPARLRIEHLDENSREFNFTLPDSWRSRPGFAELSTRRDTTCPITGVRVAADSPTYPFANERARLADLQRWFSGAYSVSRGMTDADLDDPPPGRPPLPTDPSRG